MSARSFSLWGPMGLFLCLLSTQVLGAHEVTMSPGQTITVDSPICPAAVSCSAVDDGGEISKIVGANGQCKPNLSFDGATVVIDDTKVVCKRAAP